MPLQQPRNNIRSTPNIHCDISMDTAAKQKNVVTAEEYQEARKHLLNQEKAATHLLQKLAETRRDLPMVRINDPTRFKFDTPAGEKTLLDLFDDRKQLILYHFMLGPHEKTGCGGCSFCMDHIPDLGHLHSRDTSFAAVATASIEEISAFGKRMGWKFPFYSSAKTHQAWEEAEKNGEIVTWKPGNGYFGLCSFLRDGDEVFHTYETSSRGVEIILSTYHLLDMTAMGRQELGNGMGKFRLHDEY